MLKSLSYLVYQLFAYLIKNSLVRVAVLSLVLLLIRGVTYSQDTLSMRKDEVKSAAIVSRISRELNLTSEQQAKVHEIVKTRWKSIANVKALRKQVDYTAINQDALNEVRKVLTPQQFEQLMSLQRQRAIQRKDFLEKHPDYAFSAEDKDLDF